MLTGIWLKFQLSTIQQGKAAFYQLDFFVSFIFTAVTHNLQK